MLSLLLLSVSLQAQDGAWTLKASKSVEGGGSASVVKGKIYVMGGAGNAPGYADLATNEVYDPLTDTWEQRTPVPTPRGFLATAVVNDTIYVIGGGYPTAKDVVEAYDPATDTWTAKASLLQPRIGMAASVVDGIVYIMGGNYNQRNCQAYDPRTNTWVERAPIPAGGGGWVLSATVYNGMIYVFGGSTYSPWAPLKTVFAYDPQTDTWTKRTDMPTPRFAARTYLVDGRIYVIGGSQGANTSVATVEAYDPVYDTWKTLPNMPTSLMSFAGATVDGREYVIGGTSNWGTGLTDVWQYDPLFHVDGSWTRKADMGLGAAASTCVVNGKIYVMGGAGAGPEYLDLAISEAYDPMTDTWNSLSPLPTPRGFVASAVVNDTIYVIGGGYPTRKDVVEAYDPATDAWTTKASLLQPRRGMAAAVVNGIIYLMGGNYDQRNCQAYDPGTNTWVERAPIPEGGGGWLTATAYNGLIYVFGGSTYSPWAPRNTVYAYDPQTDTWAQKTDLPTPRFAARSYLVDGRIYVMGGSQSDGTALSTVEVYDPLYDSWTAIADMPQRLMAFMCDIVDGRAYVMGGSTDWMTGPEYVWQYDPLGMTPATGIAAHQVYFPEGFVLEQNYPNPFNPSTKIRYGLPVRSRVTLSVFNTLGQQVATLVGGEMEAGFHEAVFDASGLSSGLYLYRFIGGDFIQTKKLLLLR